LLSNALIYDAIERRVIMAFNPIEYLEQGKVDFISKLSLYEFYTLIVRVRDSNNRINIVKGCLPKLKRCYPRFCFDIIYDMDEFSIEAKYLLDNYYSLESFSKEQLDNLLNNSSLGYQYLEENFDEIIDKYQTNLDFVFYYLFNNMKQCMQFLTALAYHSNLHIRFLFMKYLIINQPQNINTFYDDITRYLTTKTHQKFEQLSFINDKMDMKDVCDLAFAFFDNKIDYKMWLKFKQYILENYQYNELASHLLGLKKQYIDKNCYRLVDNLEGIEEFNKDADTLFMTSANYRFNILNGYSACVSKELLDAYRQQLMFFQHDDKIDDIYGKLDFYGISRTVEEYVDKYLSLSKDTTYAFLEPGSTSSCYRIGDYVFKLVKTKWSYEQVICPDLYLILPNLEEVLIRDNKGIVLSGIEVQKYLKRSAKDLPLRLFTNFSSELRRLGYYTSDTLMNGVCGDNCRLLDSYRDSENLNPPGWFKRYPIVLVDRDRVYKIDNKRPKQLREHY